ncbi:hypothetical protein F5Y10DRAFT_259705 [Nemania abortiva]|nr:hypothetical protein F5Y10DRAFT_259705 [Nemania abortiva]
MNSYDEYILNSSPVWANQVPRIIDSLPPPYQPPAATLPFIEPPPPYHSLNHSIDHSSQRSRVSATTESTWPGPLQRKRAVTQTRWPHGTHHIKRLWGHWRKHREKVKMRIAAVMEKEIRIRDEVLTDHLETLERW